MYIRIGVVLDIDIRILQRSPWSATWGRRDVICSALLCYAMQSGPVQSLAALGLFDFGQQPPNPDLAGYTVLSPDRYGMVR